jgi:hypothetical protein
VRAVLDSEYADSGSGVDITDGLWRSGWGWSRVTLAGLACLHLNDGVPSISRGICASAAARTGTSTAHVHLAGVSATHTRHNTGTTLQVYLSLVVAYRIDAAPPAARLSPSSRAAICSSTLQCCSVILPSSETTPSTVWLRSCLCCPPLGPLSAVVVAAPTFSFLQLDSLLQPWWSAPLSRGRVHSIRTCCHTRSLAASKVRTWTVSVRVRLWLSLVSLCFSPAQSDLSVALCIQLQKSHLPSPCRWTSTSSHRMQQRSASS